MEIRHDRQKPHDGLGEQRTLNELVKLIRKLRWIGSEKEAERVEDELALRRMPSGSDSVLAASRETD